MKRLFVFATMMFVGLSVFGQLADTTGKWRIRLRGVAVIPQESASIGVIGGDADISNSFIPELDFTYFFNCHFAAELSSVLQDIK